MSKISLAPDASGTGIFTIASPNSNTNRTLTLPDDTGTIVTNSGNQAGSFTTLNTSGAVVFNDAGADVDFRVEGDTDANLLFVDASTDRVGIGTSSPSHKLQIASAGKIAVYRSDNTRTGLLYTNNDATILESDSSSSDPLRLSAPGSSGRMDFYTSGSERARITSGGYFKASNTGSYQNATASTHEFNTNADSNEVCQFRHTDSVGQPYGVRIRYSGKSPNGTGNWFLYCDDSTALRAEIRSNGGLANYSANNVNLSDARVKKDIENLGSQWNCIKEWNLVEFRYNEQADDAPKNYGVIAQQIQEHCPEVVQVFQEAKDAVEAKEAVLDEEGNVVEPAVEAQPAQEERIGVREQQMVWMSIKALQEAMERIETLEASNTALEARIAALETGA